MKAFFGRKKTSICRVYETNNLQGMVNNSSLEEYFNVTSFINNTKLPFTICNTFIGYKAYVKGGGKSSQSHALALALSRLLSEKGLEFRQALKSNGMLTVDSRIVERKKSGRSKARRGHQRSKR